MKCNVGTQHTIVYRVESDAGVGPYISDYAVEEWTEVQHNVSDTIAAAHNGVDWPTPYEEGVMVRGGHCGFASREALGRWFEGFGELLQSAGYRVSAYLVDKENVRRGERQVVFERGDLVPFARVDMGVMCR